MNYILAEAPAIDICIIFERDGFTEILRGSTRKTYMVHIFGLLFYFYYCIVFLFYNLDIFICIRISLTIRHLFLWNRNVMQGQLNEWNII